MITTDLVESIAKVYLEETVLRLLVLLQGVAKGVSDYLDTSRATDTIVATFESNGDLRLAPNAETLGDQATKGITTGQRPNRGLVLLESDRDSSCDKSLEKCWSLPSREVVDSPSQSETKRGRLRAHALLQ